MRPPLPSLNAQAPTRPGGVAGVSSVVAVGDRGVGAEVARGIDRPHPVAVRRQGRQPGVVERGPGRRTDLGEVGAARTLAPLDAVAGDRHVVGRGRPRQAHAGRAPAVAVNARGRRRRSGVGDGLRRRRGDRGVGTEVAGRIGRPHPVAVGRRGRQAGVAVGGRGRCPHLGEVGAARTLAALHPVAGDPDRVGGGGPAEVDPGRADRRGRERRRAPSAPSCRGRASPWPRWRSRRRGSRQRRRRARGSGRWCSPPGRCC